MRPLRAPFFKMHIRLSKRLKKGIRRRVPISAFIVLRQGDTLFIVDRRRGAQLLCRNSLLGKKMASVCVVASSAVVCIAAPIARYSANTAGRFFCHPN